MPAVVPTQPACRRCSAGLSRSASLPRSRSAVPRGGCQGWYCRRTNAQLYVLLTRGVTDGPVSVQARETGAHSGCSQSIPPLWGELQAGLGGLEPAIAQGCLLGLAQCCLCQPLSHGPGEIGGQASGSHAQQPSQRPAWEGEPGPARRDPNGLKTFKSPTCPTLSLFSPSPCSVPKPQISGLAMLQNHNPGVSYLGDPGCYSGLRMSSGAFGRHHQETVEVIKKCPQTAREEETAGSRAPRAGRNWIHRFVHS